MYHLHFFNLWATPKIIIVHNPLTEVCSKRSLHKSSIQTDVSRIEYPDLFQGSNSHIGLLNKADGYSRKNFIPLIPQETNIIFTALQYMYTVAKNSSVQFCSTDSRQSFHLYLHLQCHSSREYIQSYDILMQTD